MLKLLQSSFNMKKHMCSFGNSLFENVMVFMLGFVVFAMVLTPSAKKFNKKIINNEVISYLTVSSFNVWSIDFGIHCVINICERSGI